jgi:hypothetical protein
VAKVISDAEFIEIVCDMLEFLLPKHIAKDLGVKAKDIEAWADGKDLPVGQKREKYYLLMQRHEVWDDM